ncbi:MAG: undecaprenyl/decaprenyl-phosphate alpha-N-acetylglucosaminyl 1-phosphate transferase [Candidatus Hydrogenedentes bacterium]|nr:undecaprenyl/decaprenyl-phosphate alpha-N-acetylglucosaminyl 1-phosphate transferase [Candidatus Hydrogenedentota bacterium]
MLWQLHYWPRTYIQVGCAAFVISALGMPVLIYLLRRYGVFDRVSEDKIHTHPVVRGGGIMIFLAFAIAVLWPDYFSNPMKGVILGGFICLVVGAVDDIIGGVPAVFKLVTLLVVTLVLSRYGVQLKLFKSEALDIVVTLLWIVGVTSAFNGIDNMDGLASGVATISSGMYLTIAIQAFLAAGTETSLSWFGMLSSGLVGANLGFLVYNFKPAKIFMGDSGSFFLGFMVAALGVMGEWSTHRIISCTIPVLILGVPIFDFGYILIARIVRGETRTLRAVIEHCGTDHLSHRLTWMGFSQSQSVLFIYLLAVALGVTGLLLRNSVSPVDSMLALMQGGAILAIVVILMSSATRRRAASETAMPPAGIPERRGVEGPR